MGSTTPFLDILATHLPGVVAAELPTLSTHLRSSVETLLAFALGDDCPPRLPDVAHEWTRTQPTALKALHEALAQGSKSTKRPRDKEDTDVVDPKRQKTATTADEEADDPPRFTFPSISASAPVRKKVDVTVHARSIRFTHPGTRALEATLPLARITRAFLLPTRGRSKGHWTVVLLPGDGGKTAAGAAPQTQQVMFGLDALSTGTFETTSYSYDGASTSIAPMPTTTVAKGAPTLPALRQLLSHIPVPLLEPSTSVFRSACAPSKAGERAAGVDAYFGAKSGTLWFFNQGILWGEKPCAFWAVEDLVPRDGVRMISATGRTCSVIFSRTSEVKEDEEGDGDEIVETEFSMVDGREQDPIQAWTRDRKHLFGKRQASASSSQITSSSGDKGKEARAGQPVVNGTVKGPAWDDSDSDDDDFEASSEDLEHSSMDEDSDGDGGGCARESEGEASDEGEEEEEEEEGVSEARHPLLRPGAMPRMSKAALDMVVDMVQGDLGDEASDEEDELEE